VDTADEADRYRERRFGFIEGVGDQYATLFPVTHPQI
jgi:hypothetical protein